MNLVFVQLKTNTRCREYHYK